MNFGKWETLFSECLRYSEMWRLEQSRAEAAVPDSDITSAVAESEESLSGILCVRHNMMFRKSMYAKQEESSCAGGKHGGVAADS